MEEFLNDRIIDEYMRLIRKRNGADSSLPAVYACMTHLYTGIILRGLEHTETWVKADLRTKDLILIPIHDERYVHWSLIVGGEKNLEISGDRPKRCIDPYHKL